ncbi:hypothetical protein GS597_10235 [Synechococcales cyanobacterium C]|uniref:DUF5615 domain-containing protein n=1 Tax=Petrachloros mirabilis ULC683 TaxID=2781853 RepID=A0A8K2A858_9CYAN|nr:DUF5615 family PIN-like protein [Petrachloros mirabilis]NCJ06879.1 hypothetical protein [Petrachloros mirabilis ULC683]
MDENVPKQITNGLRRRGINVLTVQEDNRARLPDPGVLSRATELSRVLFSRDSDFLVIAQSLQAEGMAFAGVIYAHSKAVSIGDCIRDLELIAKACDREVCPQQTHLPIHHVTNR